MKPREARERGKKDQTLAPVSGPSKSFSSIVNFRQKMEIESQLSRIIDSFSAAAWWKSFPRDSVAGEDETQIDH